MKRLALAAAVLAAAGLAGCGSSPPPSNAADATFLQDMIAHHTQAIAAGQLAATRGNDPRVTAFGRRIVTEQTPELHRMQAIAATLKLTLSDTEGAAMAVNRITPAELAVLRSTTGRAFDRDVITASATSEMGAVAMARTELAHGRYAPALAIARSISGAPYSEIPQLQALATALPR